MLSSGLFAGVCNLSVNVSEHCSIFVGESVLTSYLLAYEDGTACYEILALKLQMPVNNPEESI
jgi:hypothetical protein